MKAVIQRVKHASVTIDNTTTASIQNGLLVLLGIHALDTEEDVEWLSRKIAHMRLFADDNQLINRSLNDIQGDILLISQFTLHASTKKGNRPSFLQAAKPDVAIPLYQSFIHHLQTEVGKPIYTGTFGADMQVILLNDGPFTIIIDSKQKE